MDLPVIILGVATFLFGILHISNIILPNNEKVAFVILIILGVVLCAMGMKIEKYGWNNVFSIMGIVCGLLILLVIFAFFLNWDILFLTTERHYFIALIILIFIKFVIGLIRDSIG